MDWRDSWGEFEESCPDVSFEDLEWEPPLRVEIVKVEGSVTSVAAVSLVESLPKRLVEIIGGNSTVRVNFSESRNTTVEEDQILVEGGEVVSGKMEMLRWANDNNKRILRNLVNRDYEYYNKATDNLPLDEALKVWRIMRSIAPARDIASKKEPIVGSGYSSLTKVRSMLARFGWAPKVVFGVKHWGHGMGFLPGTKRCVVGNDFQVTPEESQYYVTGDLEDWKMHVDPGDIVISDCSTGSEEAGGMVIPVSYYRIYEEMVSKGHYVVCKASKKDAWVYNTRHMCSSIYKPHNMEVHMLISPIRSENKHILCRDEVDGDTRDWNKRRMYNMSRGSFYDAKDRFTITEDEIKQIANVSKVAHARGLKSTSVIDVVIGALGANKSKGWMTMCMDALYVPPQLDEYLDVSLELPAVLMDVGHMAKDVERLMASCFKVYEMSFDVDIGWVCEDLKIVEDDKG